MTRPEPASTLEAIQAQPRVEVASFGRDDAVRLGEITVAIIREWGLNLMVDVHIGDELAYRAQLGETGQRNADVIAAKRLTVGAFRTSSLQARLMTEADPSLADSLPDGAKLFGGCIPIFTGDEIMATLSSSGEPDVVDHQVIAEALRRFLAERP